MTYQQRKQRVREQAIEWQRNEKEASRSYFELLQAQMYFTRMAQRYGLTREFEDNGII